MPQIIKPATVYQVTYRVGTPDQFEWKRTQKFTNESDAINLRNDINRGGRRAYVFKVSANREAPIPDTFYPPKKDAQSHLDHFEDEDYDRGFTFLRKQGELNSRNEREYTNARIREEKKIRKTKLKVPTTSSEIVITQNKTDPNYARVSIGSVGGKQTTIRPAKKTIGDITGDNGTIDELLDSMIYAGSADNATVLVSRADGKLDRFNMSSWNRKSEIRQSLIDGRENSLVGRRRGKLGL